MTSRADKFTKNPVNPEIIYSDFTPNLDVHPDTGDLFKITNLNAIKRSLKNLILTNTYERFYQPDVGGNIYKDLFENGTQDVLYAIQKRLQNQIQLFEPRVTLQQVTIDNSQIDNNKINITLIYQVNRIPGLQNLFIPITRVR